MSLQHTQRQPCGGRRLPLPPRTVSPALGRYLRATVLPIPLALFGFGLIVFWGNCGFGADIESLLFKPPLRLTAGTVTRFEPTGARESTGTLPLTPHYALSAVASVPIYAVYFSYAPAQGAHRTGVCFANGLKSRPNMPVAEAAGDEGDLPLAPHTTVTVETVAGQPADARIRGTRTNLYEIHALIAFLFPGVGLLVLVQGRRYLRRALRLLALGQEDPAGRLSDPANAAQCVSLAVFPLNRVTVSSDELQPPPNSTFRLWGLPLLALGCNLWFIGANAKAIFYPIQVFLKFI